jgi:hypothetical protein
MPDAHGFICHGIKSACCANTRGPEGLSTLVPPHGTTTMALFAVALRHVASGALWLPRMHPFPSDIRNGLLVFDHDALDSFCRLPKSSRLPLVLGVPSSSLAILLVLRCRLPQGAIGLSLPWSSPILVLDPAAGAKAAVDPHMYWLHVGPSMEPSTGGTGTSAVVNMESIPMGFHGHPPGLRSGSLTGSSSGSVIAFVPLLNTVFMEPFHGQQSTMITIHTTRSKQLNRSIGLPMKLATSGAPDRTPVSQCQLPNSQTR